MSEQIEETGKTLKVATAGAAVGAVIATAAGIAFAVPIAIGAGVATLAYGVIKADLD